MGQALHRSRAGGQSAEREVGNGVVAAAWVAVEGVDSEDVVPPLALS